MYWRRLCASLPASYVGNTTIYYILNNIYSRNLTATSSSFYLCSKVKYNILPILIKSFFKYLSVIGCYHPIGQAIPLANNPVSKVNLRISYLRRDFWSRKSPLVLCVSDIIRVGVIALSYFPEIILYTSIMSHLTCLNAVLLIYILLNGQHCLH